MRRFGFLRFAILVVLLAGHSAYAAGQRLDVPEALEAEASGYVARIELNKPMEVESALKRAEQFYLANKLSPDLPPVVLVLHGPEVEIFKRDNYQKYKPIVDLAARLHSFNVIDVRVCRTQLRIREIEEQSLYPFVGTVAFGPAEVTRLLDDEKYLYF